MSHVNNPEYALIWHQIESQPLVIGLGTAPANGKEKLSDGRTRSVGIMSRATDIAREQRDDALTELDHLRKVNRALIGELFVALETAEAVR